MWNSFSKENKIPVLVVLKAMRATKNLFERSIQRRRFRFKFANHLQTLSNYMRNISQIIYLFGLLFNFGLYFLWTPIICILFL
jgi:hypothetical protein